MTPSGSCTEKMRDEQRLSRLVREHVESNITLLVRELAEHSVLWEPFHHCEDDVHEWHLVSPWLAQRLKERERSQSGFLSASGHGAGKPRDRRCDSTL